MTEKKSNGSSRTRNWSIIVYPESAPENWRELVDDLHIEWIESPLHEFDSNPTGEIKKAHWHLILLFGGMKTYQQVVDLVQPLNCPAPQKCLSVKGAVRYMAHLDNPEKFQYSVTDIKSHGGVDLNDLLKPSATERYSIIRDMCIFIEENHVTEFQDLVDYSIKQHFDDWFPLLCDNSAYIVGQYIKSQRCREIVAGKDKPNE